ncbi:hypothetical protein BDM02DRAFT_3110470 [Thelephora ganbajun]|uniref:Uncharacterized protein n=1 Tax=Thelephora ganbajun TaxID=370292 RepID=A0ACB6ZQ33_THEGA|nr:hypothetical protein BDM02DRAFT_3110470 [Thelephora ganbajun]
MPALLSRTLDPLLGIFTGVFAYYLAENHPRTGFAPEERLRPLVQWKWAQYRVRRNQQLESLEANVDWTGLSPEEGKR